MTLPDWTTEVVWLDVELATELLKSEVRNRGRKKTRLDRLVADLENGRWGMETPTLIVIDRDGRMIDGGHRCEAVIQTGKPIPVIMVSNVAREAAETLDAGVMRSLLDQLVMRGENDLVHPGVVGGATRCLAQEEKGIRMGERWSPGVPALVKAYEQRGHRMKPYAQDAYRINGEVKFGSPSVFLAHFFLMHEADPEHAPEFFRRLETGLHLTNKKDQIVQLRRRFLAQDSGSRRGIDPVFNGGLLRKAFNGWRQDSHRNLVYDPKREKYPPIWTWDEIQAVK